MLEPFFLIKLQAFRSATLLRDSNTSVFQRVLRNFQEYLFHASVIRNLRKVHVESHSFRIVAYCKRFRFAEKILRFPWNSNSSS